MGLQAEKNRHSTTELHFGQGCSYPRARSIVRLYARLMRNKTSSSGKRDREVGESKDEGRRGRLQESEEEDEEGGRIRAESDLHQPPPLRTSASSPTVRNGADACPSEPVRSPTGRFALATSAD